MKKQKEKLKEFVHTGPKTHYYKVPEHELKQLAIGDKPGHIQFEIATYAFSIGLTAFVSILLTTENFDNLNSWKQGVVAAVISFCALVFILYLGLWLYYKTTKENLLKTILSRPIEGSEGDDSNIESKDASSTKTKNMGDQQ